MNDLVSHGGNRMIRIHLAKDKTEYDFHLGTALKQWFFLLPAFKLAILESYPMLDKAYSIWALCSLIILVCIVLMRRIPLKPFLYTLSMVGFCAIYASMTRVFTPEAFMGSVSQSVRLLLFPFYLLAFRNVNYQSLVNSLSRFFKLLLLLDAVSVFIDYDGKLQYSLLGLDNTTIFFIIPALAIIMFNDYSRDKKISKSSIAIFLLCFIGKLYSLAASACIAMTVLTIALHVVLSKIRNSVSGFFINPIVMFGVFVLFTATVLLLHVTPVLSVILAVIGKDATMSGRTKIWALSLASILRKPIVGYGQACPGSFQNIVGLSIWAKAATHPHNYALELLWSTGVIGTYLYLHVFVGAIRKIYEYRRFKAVGLLSCGFTAFCVLMITDAYIMQPSIIILCFICLHIKELLIQSEPTDE